MRHDAQKQHNKELPEKWEQDVVLEPVKVPFEPVDMLSVAMNGVGLTVIEF